MMQDIELRIIEAGLEALYDDISATFGVLSLSTTAIVPKYTRAVLRTNLTRLAINLARESKVILDMLDDDEETER